MVTVKKASMKKGASASLTLQVQLPSWLSFSVFTEIEQDLTLLLPKTPGTRAPAMNNVKLFSKKSEHK